MRGSPLLRALVAFLIIAALGWPLWHLTRATETLAAGDSAPPMVEAKAIGLQLAFTAVPKSFAVRHLEKDVWAEGAPLPVMEREIPLVVPDEGVDLVFHIEWPEWGPLAATRVRFTDPSGETREKSVWGQGVVDEVLTFP